MSETGQKAVLVYADGRTKTIDTMVPAWHIETEATPGQDRERYFYGVEPASERMGALDAPRVGVWVYVEQPEEVFRAGQPAWRARVSETGSKA